MLVETEYPEHVSRFATKNETAIRDLLRRFPDSAGIIAIDNELFASFNIEKLAEDFGIPEDAIETYKTTPPHVLPFLVIFTYSDSSFTQFVVLGYPKTLAINAKGGSA